MTIDDRSDALAVQRTLSRFMNCFDRKEWAALAQLLAERVHVDYFDLRGEPPRTIAAGDFVEARRAALHAIDTHHLISNFDVAVHGPSADAGASCLIHRRDGAAHFTSHAMYAFRLERRSDGWVIAAIKQTILWNDGDASIHSGAKRDD
jgi:SnoaL-like domain